MDVTTNSRVWRGRLWSCPSTRRERKRDDPKCDTMQSTLTPVRHRDIQTCEGKGGNFGKGHPYMHTRRGGRRRSRPIQGSSLGPCTPRGEAPKRGRASTRSGPEQKIRRIRKKICAPRGAPKAKARKTLIKIPRKYAEEEGSPPARNCDTLHPRGGGGAERRAQV
mgnify:CR=1 FL=1